VHENARVGTWLFDLVTAIRRVAYLLCLLHR
jgi:hypothetical protein